MACVRSNTPTGVSLSAAAINFIPELIGITPQGAHTLEKETCEIVMPRQESQTPSQMQQHGLFQVHREAVHCAQQPDRRLVKPELKDMSDLRYV